MYRNELEVRRKLKVQQKIEHDLEYLQNWSKDDPIVFKAWIVENGWHRRVCTNPSDIEKFRFIRNWMDNKKKVVVKPEVVQLQLMI